MWAVDPGTTVKEKVQIKRSRCIGVWALTARNPLELLQRRQEFDRAKSGRDLHHRIDELGTRRHVGCRSVKAGPCRDAGASQMFKGFHGLAHGPSSVAEVGANADIGRNKIFSQCLCLYACCR